jgi:hypothetical protein
MTPGPGFLAVALAAVSIATAASDGHAGTIGFRTDAEVSTGAGVDAKVTLTHTGDEVADDVSVSAQLLDRTMDGASVDSIAPGKSQVWNFHLFDEIPKGSYAIVLRTRYSDTNGYPFEVISSAVANVSVKPAARIFGNIDVPRLDVDGEVTATLTAKRPPERSGSFEARLVAPSGLQVTPERLPLVFDESGKATAEFRVRNLKLLTGTTVNIFGFVEGRHDGAPQVDTLRGNVRISTPAPRVNYSMFYQAAAAFLVLLVILEGVAWATGRPRTGE